MLSALWRKRHWPGFVAVSSVMQGVKLIFFPDSHLAPKFFKVVSDYKPMTVNI